MHLLVPFKCRVARCCGPCRAEVPKFTSRLETGISLSLSRKGSGTVKGFCQQLALVWHVYAYMYLSMDSSESLFGE
ncbi:hypothetical protein HUJ04_005700 [Dendroctonus ponderosae]|nr:hypothetical protein HUJ04_005700 [Dendroctonus ponderosae]